MSPQDDEDDENDSGKRGKRKTYEISTNRVVSNPSNETAPPSSYHISKPPAIERSRVDPTTKLHPSMNDVRCGRGIPIQNYPGNVRFHSILNSYRERYQAIPRNDKSKFIKKIVREVKAAGLQFLNRKSKDDGSKESSGDEEWEIMDDAFIYEKISHGLRRRDHPTQMAKAAITSSIEQVESTQSLSIRGMSKSKQRKYRRDTTVASVVGRSRQSPPATGHPEFSSLAIVSSQITTTDALRAPGVILEGQSAGSVSATQSPFEQGLQPSQFVNDRNSSTATSFSQPQQNYHTSVPSASISLMNHPSISRESFDALVQSILGGPSSTQKATLLSSAQSVFSWLTAPLHQSYPIAHQGELLSAFLAKLAIPNLSSLGTNARLQDSNTGIPILPDPLSMALQNLSSYSQHTMISTLLGTALNVPGALTLDPSVVEGIVELLQRNITSVPQHFQTSTSPINPPILNLSTEAMASLLLALAATSRNSPGSSSNGDQNSGRDNFDPSRHPPWH